MRDWPFLVVRRHWPLAMVVRCSARRCDGVYGVRGSARSLRRRAVAAQAANRASGAARAFSSARPNLVIAVCPRLLFEERCGAQRLAIGRKLSTKSGGKPVR